MDGRDIALRQVARDDRRLELTEGMTCPRCGFQMNHQADKLTYPVTREEAESITSVMDGVIEEVFACPNCGWIESRRADPTTST